jgi:hypothetical protein
MRARTFASVIVALFLASVLVAAAGCGEKKSAKAGPQWVKTEIYLGRSIPAGGQVTNEQLAEFTDRVVTPAFPAGLTAFVAEVWR